MSTSPSPPSAAGNRAPVRDPRNPWVPSAFSRLARVHTVGVAGDALFAIGLAGSVFFSLDFDSARWRVALYLVLTIAPFAVAAPLIGPALDRIRGGRRWIIVGSMAMRAVLCVLVVRHLDSILFYPEAFGMLVLGKVYTISKSAVVPGTVRSDTELVEANSKLTILSALAVVVAAAPGGALLALGGARWALGLAAVVFAVATVLSFKLSATTVADEPPGEAEREELRSAGIFLAGAAMASVRGVVGFLAFMLAFAFKNADAPLWQLGLVAGTAQLGFFLGAVAAPRLRRLATEERILVGALVVTAVAGGVTALLGGLVGAALLSLMVGATGSAAKQAFDSILQRDAPDANRGRSFARFETRFQLVWVLGALIPIVVPIPAPVGFACIAAVSGAMALWYLVGLRRIRQGRVPVRRRGWRRRPLFGPGGRRTAGEGGDPHEPGEVAAEATAADGLHDVTAIATSVGLAVEASAAHDATEAGADGAPIGDDVPVDPARRWMRPPRPSRRPRPSAPPAAERLGEPAQVGPALHPAQLALPLDGLVAASGPESGAPDASPDASAADDPPRDSPSGRGPGLLFGPEAWDDPPPSR